jgi:hypothetical protein
MIITDVIMSFNGILLLRLAYSPVIARWMHLPLPISPPPGGSWTNFIRQNCQIRTKQAEFFLSASFLSRIRILGKSDESHDPKRIGRGRLLETVA